MFCWWHAFAAWPPIPPRQMRSPKAAHQNANRKLLLGLPPHGSAASGAFAFWGTKVVSLNLMFCSSKLASFARFGCRFVFTFAYCCSTRNVIFAFFGAHYGPKKKLLKHTHTRLIRDREMSANQPPIELLTPFSFSTGHGNYLAVGLRKIAPEGKWVFRPVDLGGGVVCAKNTRKTAPWW